MVIRECTITETPEVVTFQLDHAELTEGELLAHLEAWDSLWGRKDSNLDITETLDGIELHRRPNETLDGIELHRRPNESARHTLQPCGR
jgi:hypothetical protein